MKHSPRLSEWALDLLWRLMSLVRDVVVTLSVMDCLFREIRRSREGKKKAPRCNVAKDVDLWNGELQGLQGFLKAKK